MHRLLVSAMIALSLAQVACSQPPEVNRVAPEPPERLLTVAERSGFEATARYDEVVALLDALAKESKLARRIDMGRSAEGRAIPVLTIADPPVSTPEEAAKQKDKLVVLLLGGIHSGEVDGKEALPMLARELLDPAGGGDASKRALLKDLIILIAPIYNPDGNEKVGPLAERRPGQVGPTEGGVGTRENSAGLDLNRDFVKLDAPETRALVRFMNEWDPAVVIDTHTTNGSHHRYTITYAGPKVPAGDAALIELVRDTMMPAVSAALLEKHGVRSFWYGNFEQGHTRWETFPAEARYGTSYIGLRNRIGILSEGYSYASYKDRVLGTRDFVRECLVYAAANRRTIRKALADADKRAIEAGKKPADDDRIALRTRAVAREGKVTVLGYEEERRDGRSASTGRERDYDVELVDRFEPTVSVTRPYAYLLPATAAAVIENLQRHGIEVEELREDIDLDVEAYTISSAKRSERPFQGRRLVTIDATAAPQSRRIDAGTIVVRTGQKLGSLAAYLMEPECEDGLAVWGFFDGDLGESAGAGAEFPVVRVPTVQPMTTTKVRPLREGGADAKKKPLTFEAVYEAEKAPSFSGSPVGGLQWLEDGETFLQVKDNRLWRVNAATGRATAFHDPEAMAAALAKLPAISTKTAKSIAERTGFTMNKERTAALIEHENDLYYCRFDGQGEAVRLTSTPQKEETPSFSPDGAFVAFVRDNDLWVVDVATQTERALTSGGTDLVRNGKADWVYFEEVFNRNWRAYWWSPDSTRLAFLRIDSTPVRQYAIANDIPEPQEVEHAPYPKPGQANPTARLGIVTVAGGEVRWADAAAYDEAGHLITGVGWFPDSAAAWCYVQNRVQTWLDICSVPAAGGTPRRLLRETTGAWVDASPALKFLRDGSFLLLSERSGYKHIYRYDKAGTPIDAAASAATQKDNAARPITDGPWEVQSIAWVEDDAERPTRDGPEGDAPAADSKAADEPTGWIYLTAKKDSPIADSLYRVRLDGSGLERLTAERGSHAASVSPTGAYFVDSWSNVDSPTRVTLRSGSGQPVRRLDTNPVHALEEYRFGTVEQARIPVSGGDDGDVGQRVLEGLIIYPPDFDPLRTYPVWFMTYGGPHAPTISDSWAGGRAFDHVLATSGIIVFRADPWTASGKGAASAMPAYKQLGVAELEDIKAAIKWLVDEHTFIDAKRIGMSGHSYGGFMTAYAMTHSDLFAAGIAGAPVTDWRDYDSIYTERFMLTPQDNPGGYEKTSVVKAAKKLHGRLLLIHGGLDDNVHLQNSLRFIKALQDANKPFEFMIYPTARHGISGKHYQRTMYDFIQRTVGTPGEGSAGEQGTPPEHKPEEVAAGAGSP